MLTLGIHPVAVGILVAVFVIVSVMMMLIVLIQRPQGGGLSEAFGSSSGSGHTAFGAKTGDALTLATITIFILFLGFAIGLNYVVKPPLASLPVIEAAPVIPTPGQPVPVTAPATDAPATTTPPTDPAATTDPAPATAPPASEQPNPAPPQP